MSLPPIELNDDQWNDLRHKLIEQYGITIMIPRVQRTKLGFVVRSKSPTWGSGYYLDFWEEKYKTMFLLRYK
jgi:hypothetical protein